MEGNEIRARFDGRGRVELRPGRVTAAKKRQIDEIAYTLGYRLLSVESLGHAHCPFLYERDGAPHVRRRAEATIDRLRAGGPLVSAVEPPPPRLQRHRPRPHHSGSPGGPVRPSQTPAAASSGASGTATASASAIASTIPAASPSVTAAS